ncbi:MAG: endonuclease domain-containing protein [Comamonas sp.]
MRPLPQKLSKDSLSRWRERAGVRVLAQTLRQASTEAEQLLWRHLRARQLGGFKFRRQYPLGAYVLDFVCLEKHLVVELDGGQHNEPEQMRHDQIRTSWLQAQGFEVLRFWNHEVLQQNNDVLARVLQALTPALSHKWEREE